jgi:hypothetical protein
MNSVRILIFILLTSPLYSQVIISNKNFNYFDLMSIVNNDHHSQFLLTATFDDIGYNYEHYKIKKKYFSLNFSINYKRLWGNIGNIWVPQTTNWQKYFPKNGIQTSFAVKWFFNHRKFTFAGLKTYTGFHWLNDNKMPSEISVTRISPAIDQVIKTRNYRLGFDLWVGRKFCNHLLSEISFALGYRWDKSSVQYQCISNCITTNNSLITEKYFRGIFHFQAAMAFDLFSK